MKKLMSLILAVIMLFAVAVPGVQALAAPNYVTIYIQGYGEPIYDAEGNYIWYGGPVESMMTGLKDVLDDLLIDLGIASITGNYDEYCDRLYNAMAPAFKDLILDKDGNARDGSGIDSNMLKDPYNVRYNRIKTGEIEFEYDWRLSCEENAAILEQFIDRVCREKNYTKVNLLGRCLGGNIVAAYLQNGKNLDKIGKVILYISSTDGVDFISSLFSGKLKLNDDNIKNFVKYTLPATAKFEDQGTYEIINTLIDFVNEAYVLGFGADVIQDIFDAVKSNVLARLVRDSYGGFVSFWNMVCDEDVEDAISLIYNTPELQSEYAVMIEKIRSFHENVQVNARNRMLELKAQGIDFMVISKYNYANIPLSEDGDKQSDGTALTSATSFGATVAKFGKTLSDSYVSGIGEADRRYLSKDNMIDASTCVFPEKTWFIKNCFHDVFPSSVDKLFDAFLTTDNMTVFTDETYSQYLDFNEEADTLTPVVGIAEEDIVDESKGQKASVFIRFFTLVLNFFRKLFTGELDLGSLFGSKEA